MKAGILKRWGATRLGVWAIKQVVTPLDRRLSPPLLLTTTGRKTGQPRTTPMILSTAPKSLSME